MSSQSLRCIISVRDVIRILRYYYFFLILRQRMMSDFDVTDGAFSLDFPSKLK